MPRSDSSHVVGKTRRALVDLLVQLRDAAPDAATRRHRQQALDCARWTNTQFRTHGRFGAW